MPIEIKELCIKAVITAPREDPSRKGVPGDDLKKLKKEILEECMEKVFRKLEEKYER